MRTVLPLPAMLRRSGPALQAARVAPLAMAGAAALAVWWWQSRRRGPGERPGAWLRQVVTSRQLEGGRHEVLAFIRQTLIGLGKAEVRRLLGVPTAAGEGGMIVAAPGKARQEVAEHWYYRLDRLSPERGSALVVEFDKANRAADAKFLVSADVQA